MEMDDTQIMLARHNQQLKIVYFEFIIKLC